MSTKNVRALWKGVDRGMQLTVRGTSWTIAPYFMAHSSVIGDLPTHKRLEPMVLPLKTVRATIARSTVQAHRCTYSLDASRVYGASIDPVAVLGEEAWHGENFRFVRVPIQLGWFNAMHTLVREATGNRAELRVDPWSGTASWWRVGTRPYPIAILAGMAARTVLLPGDGA